MGKSRSLGSKPPPSLIWTTAVVTSLVCVFIFYFSLTTNSPHRSLNAPLKCNMSLHIHSKSSSLLIPCGRKSPVLLWPTGMYDLALGCFCCCSQISQQWRDFPHCPFQISNSSTPITSITLYPHTLHTIYHYLTYFIQPVLAINSSYAL